MDYPRLTKEEQQEIYDYAILRSKEIMAGIDDDLDLMFCDTEIPIIVEGDKK